MRRLIWVGWFLLAIGIATITYTGIVLNLQFSDLYLIGLVLGIAGALIIRSSKKWSKIFSLPIFSMIGSDLLIILFFLMQDQNTWHLVGDYGFKNTWNIFSITFQPSTYYILNWAFVWVLLIIFYKDLYFFMKYYTKETK
jgi:hypothetical protein